MKCLVIGCGYVGSALTKHLRGQGHHVTGTTTRSERLPEIQKIANQGLILKGDDPLNMLKAIQGQEIVFLTISAGHNDDYMSTYFKTAETLTQALKQTSSVEKIIYTSSISVYGDCNGAWVAETQPLAPNNSNGIALCLTEQLLMNKIPNHIDICIYRLGEIYGPGRELKERLTLRQGKPFPGDGSHPANIIHLNDIISALSFAMKDQLSGIYNLCNDTHPTRQELYDTLSAQYGLPKAVWDPSLPIVHGGNRLISNHKLKTKGFQFKFNAID